jgi:hypothetical protein
MSIASRRKVVEEMAAVRILCSLHALTAANGRQTLREKGKCTPPISALLAGWTRFNTYPKRKAAACASIWDARFAEARDNNLIL